MSYLETEIGRPFAETDVVAGWETDAQRRTSHFQCLVVSDSPSRRDMLTRAAVDSSWDSVVCADSASAQAEIRQTRFRLALVDVQSASGGSSGGFRELCETLAADRDVLLIVCGREGDAKEEIWARQLGVWLYLPGLAEEDDVTVLYDEARNLVEKQFGRPKPVAG